jgi:hypothetical protein
MCKETTTILEYIKNKMPAEDMVHKILTMNIGPPFCWFQNSPYCWMLWKLPDGYYFSINGWGNCTKYATHAELIGPSKNIIAKVNYMTMDEAEKLRKEEIKGNENKMKGPKRP